MREELVKVYLDTSSRIENGEYPSILKSFPIISKRYDSDDKKIKKIGLVSIDNADCVDIADRLSRSGKTCILNMASYKNPGGGVHKGAKSQEEDLCRRSNLIFGLDRNLYPLDVNTGIYTKDVTFFKDKYYNIIDPFKCDVITIAAVNISYGDIPKNYDEVMENKISTILYVPYQNGCKNLVLSAFGCGVFKNNPLYVAGIFKKLLNEGFSSLYNKISFAIINDHNSSSDNYSVFKTILE